MADDSVTNRRRRAPIWGGGLTAFTEQGAVLPPDAAYQTAPGVTPGMASTPYPAPSHFPQPAPAYPQSAPAYPQSTPFLPQSGTQPFAPPASSVGSALVPAAQPNLPPQEALRRLLEGNRRFVTQPHVCSANLANASHARAVEQAPYAVILGCSDSRVAPELIFGGAGPGELFVARNAGNLADEFTIGTVELGTSYLGASVVMVLAHEACGAVKAACDIVVANTYYPPSIEDIVQPIIPAALAVRTMPGDFVSNALRENARRTARRMVERSSILAGLVQQGRLQIVAAEFSITTGRVELL